MLVPQEGYVFPMMSVKANLEVSGLLNSEGDNEKLIGYVYELFPILSERERQIASTLSGGQQKMLAIGIGIVSNAKVMLVDEPSIGLAPKLVTKLFENLRQIKEDTGKTLVLSEQNVKILKIADRIFGLEAGEIRFSERTEDLDESMVTELYMGE
jgi:branched-chain amino acid transport system ATP-binding protein